MHGVHRDQNTNGFMRGEGPVWDQLVDRDPLHGGPAQLLSGYQRSNTCMLWALSSYVYLKPGLPYATVHCPKNKSESSHT